ncbi:MAG: HAD family phosphatase [Gemmatimonadetes bacterium]|nr:HAD family phosphatase [Gemmatimonadota bacterium]
MKPDSTDIRACLFDLGGVVIEIDFQRAFNEWASAAGMDSRAIADRFRFDDAYSCHERGEIEASVYFNHLRTSLGIDLSDSEFARGWGAIYVGEMPGIRETLSMLATKLPLYAFTNSNPTHEQFWEVSYRDLLQPFQQVFNSSSLGCRKPELAAFQAVSLEIDIPLVNIMFFDDLQENVDGAVAAGLHAVRVASAEDVRDATTYLWPS